ncbi:MAG: divalent-cation tolerance protein CutA [Candidatus Magnetoovum sp. WYHC-5]|nr:divalent-cation tolerance protein CutA [Candidatus Magnetoovum sp. WYHC-5]
MDYYVALITAPNVDEAVKIANTLVSENIVKCVNIIKEIRSIYSWKGNVEDEPETLLVCKLKKDNFDSLKDKVKTLHSYEVPEIIALPIVESSKDYLDWLNS